MREATKDRLRDTVIHDIVSKMVHFEITNEDLDEYRGRVPVVKERMLTHREKAAREQKRVRALAEAREQKRLAKQEK
jgi:hypothetical protein